MQDRPIVGRASELARLETAFSAASDGSGGIAVVGGEPGIGKTRLAHALSAVATTRGAAVGWGQCVSPEAAPAYWPLAEALDGLLDAAPDAAATLSPTDQLVLAPIVPRWATTPAPYPVDPAQSRFLLARATTRLLDALGKHAPLLVVLDDLHAADLATLALLELLAPALPRLPVLVLITHRIAEVQAAPELARALARITREALTLAPTGLSADDVAALLAQRGLDDPDLGRAVFVATQGNPLFAHEIATSLLRRGQRGLPRGESLPLPWGVRDAVRERLAALGDDARSVIELLAIAGEPLPTPSIATLAEFSLDHAASVLSEAAELGVLDERHRFTHPLLREVQLRDLPPSRAAALHGKLADHLLADEARGVSISAAVLTRHMLGAGPGRLTEAAARAVAAADAAVGVSAWEDAIRLLERVDDRLLQSATDPRLRAEVRLALGDALFLAGRHAEGERACEDASAIARQLGDAGLLARSALTFGRVIRVGTNSRRLRELLEEALAVVGDDEPELRARVLARLAAVRQPSWDPEAPMALAREAFALAEQGMDPRTRLDVLYAGMAALADYADPSERRPLNATCVALAVELGDQPREFRGRLRLTFDLLELGRPDEAAEEGLAASRIAEALESVQMRVLAGLATSAVAAARGDAPKAHALAREADALLQKHGVVGMRMTRVFHNIAWKLHDGSNPLGMGVPEDWFELLPGGRFGTALRASIRAALAAADGDVTRAREVLDEIEPAYFERILDPMEVATLCYTTRRAGWTRRKAELDAQLERMGERWESWGLACMTCFGPMARHRDAPPSVTPPPRPPSMGATMELEGDTWLLQWGEHRVRVRSRRGEQLLAALLARPGEEVHVLELAGGDGEGSDAGPVLDEEARRQYRRRLRELGERLEDAKARADEEAAARIDDEIEVLHGELARAFGLGGRARRAGSAAERARVAVRKRLAEALDRIAQLDPELGRHLQESVRTGAFCVYRPSSPP